MHSEGEKSFEAAALPHLEFIYRVALKLARNEHKAEDLVQETYVRACNAFARFELREYGIRPWLLKILHNAYFSRLAKDSRAPMSIDDPTVQEVQDRTRAAAPLGNPPALNYEELDEEVKEAIERMPSDYRAVLLLWATGELGYQEIADVLGLPLGTVMSRMHRCRRQLIDRLEDYARENRVPIAKGRQ